MVRLIHKTKIAAIATLAVATPVFVAPLAKADNPQSVDFNVNVAEVLTVSITDPTSWASGKLDNYNTTTEKWESDFLRNKVTVSAATNNAVGVTVSMYTNNTSLINQTNNTDTIPTLSAATQKSAVEANHWGYSLTDTDAGEDATYSPLQTTAIPVFTTTTETDKSSGSQSIFFGAKADTSAKSGTYAQTVYFAAVTGTVDTDNPVTPVNPSTPVPVDNTPVYASTAGVGTGGQTSYTTRVTSGSGESATKTTTTEVSKGNTTSSYTAPAGVTTTSGINSGSTVATALGVAAGVAAASGITFFVLAKRRKDDDDEEE